MNWEEIRNKYQKAYSKLIEHSQGADDVCPLFHWRDLYDFFDESDIIIEVHHTGADDPRPIGVPRGWWSRINNRSYIRTKETRTEAETAAFEKAFEILEKKL